MHQEFVEGFSLLRIISGSSSVVTASLLERAKMMIGVRIVKSGLLLSGLKRDLGLSERYRFEV